MELQKALKTRRSVRQFTEQDVDKAIVDEILKAGNLAPCTDSCNYFFGVITDDDTKQRIAQATVSAEWVAKAPLIIVCCSNIEYDMQKDDDDSYVIRGLRGRYGEEVLEFFRSAKDRKACKTLIQATPVYIAAQQMVLTAVSHGLRGCMVDFINIPAMNAMLQLPDHITCELILPLGYPESEGVPIKLNEPGNIFYEQWERSSV